MLTPDGEAKLQHFSASAFPPAVTEVSPGKIFHVMGYGHSNAGFIIGNESVILVDTLDTDARGAKLLDLIRSQTDKPVRTIIYTHGHPDHRSGARAFAHLNPEIIAFSPATPMLPRMNQLADIQDRRGTWQFGYELNDEEAISQGIGIREGFTSGHGVRGPLPPTTVYEQEEVERDIDGVRITLRSAPGETEDQVFVWLEDQQILFCGDNYYGCWPNLYAIRGGQYRDIATWVASLDRMRQLPAEALLPGHTQPVLGRAKVAEVLGNFRDAIDFVLSRTLSCMNEGMGLEETVASVTLPERFSQLPYLQEHYGTVAWSVRSIYTGYLGWFDGNPTHLNPLPPRVRAEKLIDLMGGRAVVDQTVRDALEAGDSQWAIELADMLLVLEPENVDIRHAKARGLRDLGRQETSANGRHFYFAFAKVLEETP